MANYCRAVTKCLRGTVALLAISMVYGSSYCIREEKLRYSSDSEYRRKDRARTCNCLRSRGIDSNRFRQPMSYVYVALRSDTSNKVVVPPARQAGNRFLGSFKSLQIWALVAVSQWKLLYLPEGMVDGANSVAV